jgi:hypothetical protein
MPEMGEHLVSREKPRRVAHCLKTARLRLIYLKALFFLLWCRPHVVHIQWLANGEEDLKTRRQALGRRLAEAHRAENTTLLEQVFTAESFSDVLTDTSAYRLRRPDAQLAHDRRTSKPSTGCVC